MNSPTIEQVKQFAGRLSEQSSIGKIDEKALHCYRTPDGLPLYWRLRVKNTTTGEKWIRPFWKNGESFALGEPPGPPEGKPLYALELLTIYPDATVVVCEGENKADAINKVAMKSDKTDLIVATTSGGASSAHAANWQPLAGRAVVVWPDNDEAGAKYSKHVVERLKGIAVSVKVMEIATMNLPHKGDAVDFFKIGGSIEGLNQAIDSACLVSASVYTKSAPQGSEISDLNDKGNTYPPEPLPALPGVLPFDYAYLPDGLRGFVKDISERMQCPPDFAAVAVFVMMATIIGRKVGIRPMRHNDWTVIPNLWGAVVGNSGVMKSPTLGAALSPIGRLASAAFETYNKVKVEYDEQAELARLQQSVNKTRAREKLKKDQSADVKGFLQSSDSNEAPILKRYKTNNASYEALGELMMENPNGLLVEADEIIGLLKQLDAGGQEVARSFYLTAADGDKPYTFDRIMRGKGLHIDALCLSIIGGIQPGVLAEYVRQAMGGGAGADGLLQRFGLMVYPDISPDWKEVDRYPDSELRQSVNQLAERLDDLDPHDIGAEEDAYGGIEGNLASTRTELGGDIARNHEELVALQKKGERTYYEFSFEKSKTYHHTGPISIALRKADTKHGYCDLEMVVDDKAITRKHVNLYESVSFYPEGYPLPLEVVINHIDKDSVRGYVSEPKYRSKEQAAVPAPSPTSASVNPPAPAARRPTGAPQNRVH